MSHSYENTPDILPLILWLNTLCQEYGVNILFFIRKKSKFTIGKSRNIMLPWANLQQLVEFIISFFNFIFTLAALVVVLHGRLRWQVWMVWILDKTGSCSGILGCLRRPDSNKGIQFIRSATVMLTSSNGNIFPVTGRLCLEFAGHQWVPLTKANDAELWCVHWSAPE